MGAMRDRAKIAVPLAVFGALLTCIAWSAIDPDELALRLAILFVLCSVVILVPNYIVGRRKR
jgi:hypothetical protein